MLLDCEPVFDYGRCAAEWEYSGAGYHQAKATGVWDGPARRATDGAS